MNIEEIRLKWKTKEQNKEMNISLWDEKADYFGNYIIPTDKDDKFIKLLQDKKLIDKDFEVLDIGCGGGKYTLALSSKCKNIYGIDLSPKMIDYAIINKDKLHIDNAYFICDDWHDIDVQNSNLYKKFDLVFASMTPAIQSASTFEKMNKVSKKYCVLRCNIKRRDFIYDKIIKRLGIYQEKENLNFLYAFNMVYLQGYNPKIYYEDKNWSYEESLEKAQKTYIKKIKTMKIINNSEENKIKKFLQDISSNGYIKENINSTIATLIWCVDKEEVLI